VGGSIFGLVGGIYYWFPKITGRMMDDRLGRWNFWTTFLGFNLTFFPMHFLGLAGMPRRYYTYGEGSGWGFWNAIVSFGAFFLAASILLFVYNLGNSLRNGKPAGNNPWDAATLEWALPSPPPVYNFAQVPQIGHRDPLWWDKYDQKTGGGHDAPGDPQEIDTVNQIRGPIHLPNPSYYPIVASIGILVGALGLLFDNPKITIGLLHLPTLCVLGILIFVSGVFGWALEPAS
jgi:cytochrome c oxidase subunit 1